MIPDSGYVVEAGIRIVGEAAWWSCQRLQVVHLPDTVVCLQHGAFRRCYLLRAVMAPGNSVSRS